MEDTKFVLRKLGEESPKPETVRDESLDSSNSIKEANSGLKYDLEVTKDNSLKAISPQNSAMSTEVKNRPGEKTKLQLKKKTAVFLEGNSCPDCGAKVKKRAASCKSCGQEFFIKNKTNANLSSAPQFKRGVNPSNTKIRYKGINRITYWILCIASTPLFLMGQIKTIDQNMPLFVLITSFAGIFGLFLGVKRLQNTGTSGFFILTAIIPLVNLWTVYRLWICQPGYSHNGHKLDFWGKLLSLPYSLIIIMVITRAMGQS